MVVGRTLSSLVSRPSGVVSGAVSASKRPASQARAALACELAEKASIVSRSSFQRAAISSALTPCGGSPSG